MDKIEQLYKLYLEEGLITSATTIEMFSNADDTAKGKLYDLGRENNLFTETDSGTFKSAWSIEPAKTEAVATETAPVTAENQAVDTDLESEVTSSELPKPKTDYTSQIKSSEFFEENVPYKGSEQEKVDKQYDKKDSSATIDDLLKTLDGVKYKKESGKFETDDSVGMDVFQKEEEQAVPIFSEMFKGSGINFEETSIGGLNPFTGMPSVDLDAMTVSIGEKGSSSYKSIDIPLEIEGGVASENLTKLKSFIKENKDIVNTYDWSRNSRQAEKAYDTWEDSNVNIKQGEEVIKQETLKNPNYFEVLDEANKPKTSAEKYADARASYASHGYTHRNKLAAKEDLENKLKEAKTILLKKNPEISSDELDKAARDIVRQQDYQQKLADLKLKERDLAIKRGEISASIMYAGGVASKNKKTEKFNKDLDVTNTIIDQTRLTNNDTEFLFNNVKKAYSENGDGVVVTPENQNEVLRIAEKLGLNLDMLDKSQVKLENGNVISSNYYKIMQASRDASTAGSLLINDRLKKQSDLASSIGDDDLSLIAAGKNYNMWDQAANSVLLGAGDLLVGAGRLTAEINPFTLVERVEQAVRGDVEGAFSPKFAKLGADWVEFSSKDRETYARSVSFDDAFSSGGNFMQFALQETATQIPIIAAMVASGGTAAPWVIGASTMGSKMNELGYENINLADGEKYSNSDVWLKSLGYGLLEGSLSAVSGTRVLRNAKTRFISGGKEAAETLLENSAKTWGKEQGKGYLADVIVESGAEALTTGGQNLIDGKPFTENMAHAAFSGFGMSTLMGGTPYFRGLYYSSMSNYAALSDIRGIQSDIDALSKRWATAQTESGAKIYAEAIADKYTKLNDAIVKQESLINNNLTSGGANKIVEITSKLAALQNKAKAISESKDLSTEEKNAQIKPLLADFNSLKSLRDKALEHSSLLKNETEFKAFKALQPLKHDQYIDQATQELTGERNGKKPNDIDVDNRAYDLYFGDIIREENAKLGRKNSNVFKRFKSFETVDEAIADLDNVKDLSPEDKAEITIGLKNGNDGYANPSTDTQVAVVENQVANQRRYTKVHEIGHKAFWNLLGNDSNNAAFKQVSNQILSTLKKTDKKVHDSLLKDGVDDDSGNIIPAEVISRFLEYVSEGKVTNVQKAKGISGLFGVMIQKEFSGDYNFDFKGEQDIYNFVVGVGKKIKDGTLTTADIKKAKSGDLIKSVTKDSDKTVSKESSVSFSSNSILSLENKIDEIYDAYLSGDIDQDSYDQQTQNIEDKIIALQTKSVKVEEPKAAVVKPKKKVSKEVEKSIEEFEKEASEEVSISNANKKIAKINEDITNEMIDLGAKKVSDIKDPVKRKQIIDKLGRNNVGAVTNLAKKAAAAGKNLGIDDISRVDYDEFFSGFSEELSALIKSYKTDVDGKKVPFGAYMAKNLPLRYGQILDKALQGKVQGSKSLDTEAGVAGAVSEVSGDANTSLYGDNIDSGKPAGKLIDVTEFPRVKDKEAEIRDAVDIDGLDIENLTYKDVQNSFAGEVGAIILDVHGKSAESLNKNLAERIMGTRTLNYGKKGNAGEVEVKAMQSLFKNYNDVVKFIKTMPEYNIAPRETTIDKQGKSIDLTDDAKGYAIGVSNKILKQFYEPYIDPKSKSTDANVKAQAITSPSGRGKAKTSQVATVYRLKPEYRGNISKPTVQDLQRMVGITPAGKASIPIIGKKRAEFGTALQGLTKIYAANVANTIVRKKIVEQGVKPKTKTIDQALADIGGGKSNVMFSKSFKLGLENGSNTDNIASVLFSKSARSNYEQVLRAKRPELEDIPSQVDNLIKWADNLDIKENKKAKYKKLGLFYMANGYVIFPEDGYKVAEAIRLATINKVDPYAFNNPNELIEKYEKVTKIAKVNPDTVSEFSNKEEISGYTIYDVQDSKKGQEAVRRIVDSNWGEKSNPWCLVARTNDTYLGHEEAYSEKEVEDIIATNEALGNTVEREGHYMSNGRKVYELVVYAPKNGGELARSFGLWKGYNESGNGFKIAFKNGKLNSFRDGNDMLWWDRMDKPKKGPDMKAKPDANGLRADGYFDLESGDNVVEGYVKDYKKGNLTIEEEYNKDKELTNRNTFEATENSNKSLIESYSMDRLDGDDYIETETKYKDATDRTIKTTRKLGDIHVEEVRKKYYDRNDNFVDQRKEKDFKTGNIKEEIIFTDNSDTGSLEGFTIYKAETIDGEKNVLIDNRKDFTSSGVIFSKSINKNLSKSNKNYVNFRKLIKNREMFHGGSRTAYNEATWFYLDDAEAAEMWGDGKVYKAKASSLDDYLIIPDLNDVTEYHKHASKKFGLPEENFFDVRDIIKLPNAEEIISDWIDWATKNETDWDLGYNLYEDGKITNGAAVTVIGKIPESSLELAQDSVNKDESTSNVIFNEEVALENNIDPKTLTGVLFSKGLNKNEIEVKSKLINKKAEKAWIQSQGDKELFYNLMNNSLRKTTLKNKKLQRNIRRIPNATSTRGNLTEYFQWYKLNDNTALKEYLGIKKLIPKKWNSKNDIEAVFEDGSIEGIEVKMSWEDIMGSTSMHYDLDGKFVSVKHDNGVDKLSSVIMDSINKNQEIIKLANEGLENAAKLENVNKNSSGEVSYPFAIQSETDAKARINRKNLNRPIFNTIEMDVSQVIEHYTKKDVGLIIIGDQIFYIQDKRNKFKNASTPIKKLNTKAALKIRIKPSGIRYSPRFKKYIDTYSLVAQFQFSEKPKGGVLFSKAVGSLLDKQFNDIIENKTGIESYKNYKRVKAQVTGASKGKFNFFIAPSAEDFVGLLYKTLGKGKIGDAQMAWYKENLLDPYARAMQKVSRDRNFMARNFLAIKKELKIVPKNLKKKIPGEPFTQEQAIRVYIWNKKGSTIPEISENDSIYLTNFVENNEKLKTFADQVIALSGLEDYAKPGDSWVTGTITTDMLEALNTTKRAKYLELWQQNADEIFSEKNLNKLEAAYGADYRYAMENILKRMKTGRNRAFGGDSLTGRLVDWLTGATGAIMFFNTRSAVLQTLSAINFINFGDNNIFAASKAFANQKQYWSDFKMLFNSDFLVERRDGLKMNVNEADIADIAKEKGVRGLINKMLKLGFTPTQLADSFAIAAGGATFYRNRLKSLIKDGMDPVAAEKQAMTDFRETAEESQQSSRPDKISAQQAGPLGRTILAFSNTPAQYARIIKKAASDIKNGRGDLKTNVSKIMYYAVAQNLLFNALQKALFAAMFDEDEEEIDDKTINIANGMIDSILVGTGIAGAIVSVLKNVAVRWVKEEEKANPKYENAVFELLKISPPLSSKVNKLRAASRSYDWDRDKMKEKGFSIDNPANLAIGNVVSAVTNIPLDRIVKKVENIKAASDSEIETYKKIFLLAGWSKWDLGIKKSKKSAVPTGVTKYKDIKYKDIKYKDIKYK